jgi:hypothetical protein
MPQKPLGKAGKSLNKKKVPPSRISAKIAKRGKGACAAAALATPRRSRARARRAGKLSFANSKVDKASADSNKARAQPQSAVAAAR